MPTTDNPRKYGTYFRYTELNGGYFDVAFSALGNDNVRFNMKYNVLTLTQMSPRNSVINS